MRSLATDRSVDIELPVLHADQIRAYDVIAANRFVALRAGRRWGKTVLGETISADGALKSKHIGWFAPEYKFLSESYRDLADILLPARKSSNATEGIYRLITGGTLTFWSLDNDRAGRGRKYHTVIIDEGAFTKPNMMDIWNKSIKPTLLDYGGNAIVLSNTNGADSENFLWRICHEPEHGFVQYHAPTHSNPHLPAEEIAKLQSENHPLVYQQEYLAEFVDWRGVAFFSLDSLLIDGAPAPTPRNCDVIFATLDTAAKTGSLNDGTGISIWAYNRYAGIPLTLLDWDLVQIEGALLESWLPSQFALCESYAVECKARYGFRGIWIEDKSSGTVLLQQAKRRNWPAHEIESKLTSMGKDERALNASTYFYRGLIKISQRAYDKVVSFKGSTRNHWLQQVTTFRIGDKEAIKAKRADDLLDTACYGAILALGSKDGF